MILIVQCKFKQQIRKWSLLISLKYGGRSMFKRGETESPSDDNWIDLATHAVRGLPNSFI